MSNKKMVNLLRAVADFMDETTENTPVEKTEKDSQKKKDEDFIKHTLALIKKIEEKDVIRAYKNKLKDADKKYGGVFEEIEKLREQAISEFFITDKEVVDAVN